MYSLMSTTRFSLPSNYFMSSESLGYHTEIIRLFFVNLIKQKSCVIKCALLIATFCNPCLQLMPNDMTNHMHLFSYPQSRRFGTNHYRSYGVSTTATCLSMSLINTSQRKTYSNMIVIPLQRITTYYICNPLRRYCFIVIVITLKHPRRGRQPSHEL